ncbi:MAG TPA: hypothetical protein VHE30_01470 [Polyangiaceae bacterium]|nr:hypothetical protein [Polyangiaceae bacterium]
MGLREDARAAASRPYTETRGRLKPNDPEYIRMRAERADFIAWWRAERKANAAATPPEEPAPSSSSSRPSPRPATRVVAPPAPARDLGDVVVDRMLAARGKSPDGSPMPGAVPTATVAAPAPMPPGKDLGDLVADRLEAARGKKS